MLVTSTNTNERKRRGKRILFNFDVSVMSLKGRFIGSLLKLADDSDCFPFGQRINQHLRSLSLKIEAEARKSCIKV